MAKLTLTRAFADCGATLINPRWSCSEIASDKSLVFSGWDHLLRKKGNRVYEDRSGEGGMNSRRGVNSPVMLLSESL